MATGNEILAYPGSGGLGSNAGIPAVADINFDVITRTADRLQMQNAQQNQQIFQQKLKERDKLLEAIDSGKIKVGDILEEDMAPVKEGLQKLDDAYFNRIKKGVNDIDAAREYNKALREAQDRVTQAEARKVFHTSLTTKMAAEKLPRKQAAMQQHLDSTLKKGFFADLLPYQQTLDFDFDPIKGYVKMKTTVGQDPKNSLYKVKTTTADVQSTLQEARKDFLENNEAQQNQAALINEYQKLPPLELKEQLIAFNNRLQPVGVKIEYEEFPDGTIAIKESTPDFAAKWALAANPQLNASERELDEGAFKIYKEQQDVRHDKAMEGIGATNAAANLKRAQAYSALQNKKLSQLNEEEKRVKNFWNEVTGKVKFKKLTNGQESDVVFAGDLPEGYKYIGGLDADGKPIRLEPIRGPKGTEYYNTKYFDSNGSELDLRSQYIEYQKQGGTGSYDQLRTNLLKAGKINMELVGQNGVGNFETAGQATRAISNKGTTKGETPIFYEEEE